MKKDNRIVFEISAKTISTGQAELLRCLNSQCFAWTLNEALINARVPLRVEDSGNGRGVYFKRCDGKSRHPKLDLLYKSRRLNDLKLFIKGWLARAEVTP